MTTKYLVRFVQNWFTRLPQSKSGRKKLADWDDCEVIVEQLRQVWNARGAADLANVEQLLDRTNGVTGMTAEGKAGYRTALRDAREMLRTLDRPPTGEGAHDRD